MADSAHAPAPAKLDIQTLGCRLNAYESEVMRKHAEAAGLGDAVIVNTCAVTAEAVRQARQTIRRAHRERPDAPVIVTGCAAQIDPEAFAGMPEVAHVVGNAEKMRAETFRALAGGGAARVTAGDIMAERETSAHAVDGLDGRARAFVQVQTGCDHRCTFCVIPFGRGNSRSVPPQDVIEQVRRLVDTGHHEVVLTGVDLTSWGADLEGAPRLGDLVGRVLREAPDLPQLRLSSIDAIEIDDALFELVTGDARIAPHLHLSLQSGDDMILKRMKRRHLRAQAIELCARLRAARPGIAFGADFIAGFPTETDDMFANTLDLIETCGIDYVHAFPFSPRPGTPAARMPQLDRETVKARAARLRETADRRLTLRLDRHVGARAMALVERGGRARLPDFTPVRIEQTDGAGEGLLAGRPALFEFHARTQTELLGRAVSGETA
ncbi:MAG: tRNA (N(6)-L-threonylcarbamoyladenosine(37)-C(2))-methylthiotransferase MtaB [Hyphomonadaceae bacterium]